MGLAAITSLAGVLLVERNAAHLGLLDRPNSRSSHVQTRPRGGGLGIVAGMIVGLVIADWLGGGANLVPWGLIGGAALVALIGLRDDLAPVSPLVRLIVQTGAAVAVVSLYGGFETFPLPAPLDWPVGAAGMFLAVLWIVGVTNFFNFMDGADGLAAGQACLTWAALCLVLWDAPVRVVPLCGFVATAAFLLRNWAPARVFLGDVGSGWLGFLLAGMPLAAGTASPEPLALLVATSLGLFLIDPTVTLARRAARGARLMASHREHAYQQLIVPGQSHARPVASLLFAASILSLAAVAIHQREGAASWWGPGLVVVLFLVECLAAGGTRRN